jgi:hypothetical protein
MKKLLIAGLFVMGCASEHKMKELSTPLDVKGQISSNEFIGLNQSGEAIIQTKEKADQELRGWIWQNNNDEQEVNSTWHELKRCREDASDVRLGGSGEVVELPEIDNMKPTIEVKEQVGLINRDMVVVKESFYKDRLAQEKSYNDTLSKMMRTIKKYKTKCEFTLSQKRVKVGLPAEKVQGKFIISPDGKLEGIAQKHEKNLDDAFEMKKEREPASSPVSED